MTDIGKQSKKTFAKFLPAIVVIVIAICCISSSLSSWFFRENEKCGVNPPEGKKGQCDMAFSGSSSLSCGGLIMFMVGAILFIRPLLSTAISG
jgi:Na+/H+ antiporter NhaD/arsenite permease-like protein